VAGTGINPEGINRFFRDLQEEFDRNGPIRVPVEVDSRSRATGDLRAGHAVMDLDETIIRLLDWLLDNGGEIAHLGIADFQPEVDLDEDRRYALAERLEDLRLGEIQKAFGPARVKLTSQGGLFTRLDKTVAR
jgi:hypothetical protein